MNLLTNLKVTRHNGPVAAGTTTITPSAGIDMKGFESCLFIVPFGAITAGGVQSIEVHQSSDDGVGDAYSALAGTNVAVADDDDNKYAMVEVRNPGKRYLKCIVNRATQNSAIDGIVALQGTTARKKPTTQPDEVAAGSEVHVGPDEGTA